MKKDKKNTKQKLFEMMHKVGGMPLNENLGDYYGKYDYSSDVIYKCYISASN